MTAEPGTPADSAKRTESTAPPPLDRRRFLRRAAIAVGATGMAGVAVLGYSRFEAGWVRIRHEIITVPRLPAPFRGKRVALLSDIHHGPFTDLDYIEHVVALTNDLSPDVVALAGDYVHRDHQYIRPCLAAHRQLRAPLGVFGVLGNHDHWEGPETTRESMRAAGVVELTNTGVWLEADGARLRIAGVGDFWEDRQDLDAALGDTSAAETALLLSHNPDFVETIRDPRVGLVLSGHTHGGQIVLPVVGPPRVPSRYGRKYLRGLVQTPTTQVYVTRGLGTVTLPFRFHCRPEIVLIELA